MVISNPIYLFVLVIFGGLVVLLHKLNMLKPILNLLQQAAYQAFQQYSSGGGGSGGGADKPKKD